MSTERYVTAPDGRTLCVAEGGDPSGVPVLRHHGTPGSRLIADEDSELAQGRGIRLIAYDRPGYGGSTRLEGRNVADCAADVRAIAGALEIRRMAVFGGSGGGPHALACAALLDGLVAAASALCSVAPFGMPGLKWTDGMGEGNIAEFDAVRAGAQSGRRFMEQDMSGIAGADPEEMRRSMITLLSPVDAEALTGQRARDTLAQMQLALAPGVDGWLDDDLAFLGDWGFGLSQIQLPVLVVHGRQDRFVPAEHGEWLAAAVPGAEPRIFDDDGHISLRANHLGEALDWLRERAV